MLFGPAPGWSPNPAPLAVMVLAAPPPRWPPAPPPGGRPLAASGFRERSRSSSAPSPKAISEVFRQRVHVGFVDRLGFARLTTLGTRPFKLADPLRERGVLTSGGIVEIVVPGHFDPSGRVLALVRIEPLGERRAMVGECADHCMRLLEARREVLAHSLSPGPGNGRRRPPTARSMAACVAELVPGVPGIGTPAVPRGAGVGSGPGLARGGACSGSYPGIGFSPLLE